MMRPRHITPCLSRLALLALCYAVAPSVAGAQRGPARTLGRVGQLTVVGSKPPCRALERDAGAPGATIERAGRPAVRLQVGDTASLFVGDAFSVAPRADVRLEIADAARFGEGWFVLAPSLLCASRHQFGEDTSIAARGHVSRGSYEVKAPSNTLFFHVDHGGAVISWNSRTGRPLTVVVGSVEIPITGTELAVYADSTRGVGFVYVREGSVRFPRDGAADLVAEAGRAVSLAPAGARLLAPRSAVPFAQAEEDISDHCAVIECPGLGRAPPPRLCSGWWPCLSGRGKTGVVGGAVIGLATAVYVWRGVDTGCWRLGSCGASRRSVTVVVEVPL